MSEDEKLSPKTIRRALFIAGGIALFFSLYLLVFLVPDFIRSAVGPESMSVEQAAEIASESSRYVLITNGEWNCNTIDYAYERLTGSQARTVASTQVLLTNSQRNTSIRTSLSGELDCDDLQNTEASGYLSRTGNGPLELCGYCGAENSAIGVGFGVVIALIGLGLIGWGLRIPPQATEPEQIETAAIAG